jgi:hypothetical protein
MENEVERAQDSLNRLTAIALMLNDQKVLDSALTTQAVFKILKEINSPQLPELCTAIFRCYIGISYHLSVDKSKK